MAGEYSPLLARIHAEAYAKVHDAALGWIARQILKGPAPANLFDIGCGDGRWMAYAQSQGIKAAGCDISRPFVEMARERGLDVDEATALQAPTPAGVTALTGLGEVLCYLDPDTQDASLWPLVDRWSDHMPSGGILLADLIGPKTPSRVHESEGDGWKMVSDVTVTDAFLTRKITLTSSAGVEETVHKQRVFQPEAIRAGAEERGLNIRLLSGYGITPLLPGRFVVKLEWP